MQDPMHRDLRRNGTNRIPAQFLARFPIAPSLRLRVPVLGAWQRSSLTLSATKGPCAD